MTKHTITIPGIPAPQGSKRHVGGGRMIESSKAVRPYRDSIMTIARDAGWHTDPILTGPVRVNIIFRMPRPASHYGTGRNAGKLKNNAPIYHDKTKDVDKLCRSVLDALTQAGVWKDDGQVAHLSAIKVYGDTPETVITLHRIHT
ncbi:MAG: Crossover junction endodeoxyribonuclease RusA [Actinobacteria bacterium ADurb.Bin444]|nr:MAG: Crossover junction endodeoxyribonuclease RusA [Actinobacteria bacterium ADurb.Bin444]